MSNYYPTESDSGVSNLARLQIELNNKLYYESSVYEMYLRENGLEPNATYNKNTDYKKLLQTVRDILESLTNDIDLFRTVETEFATTSQAYQYLERRLNNLDKKILALSDSVEEDLNKSMITFLFKG